MASRRRQQPDQLMFPNLPEGTGPVIPRTRLQAPVWTEHKARVIARYLHYFVMITRHGNYIDGFAGPQGEQADGAEDRWAARLVMGNTPRWLRKFFLVELDLTQFAAVERLIEQDRAVDARPREPGVRPPPRRTYWPRRGDFNTEVDALLASGLIKPREASFALLDQRGIECNWATVRKLAAHRPSPKIELFYFLATGWLDRTIAAHSKDNHAPIDEWWGGPGWNPTPRNRWGWANRMSERMRDELGYTYVNAWPFFERPHGGGNIKFHMIHATDHPDATALMNRAYNRVLEPLEDVEQLELALQQVQDDADSTEQDGAGDR